MRSADVRARGTIHRLAAFVATVALVAVAAVSPSARAADEKDVRTLRVFAAASLTAAFREMSSAFERANPGTKVELNFAGTPTLVQQIREGAEADVLASADEPNMQKLVDAKGVAGTPRIFARNVLQIVVEKGNPERIAGLADLARPGLVVVLCGDTVPAGRYAIEAFRKAGATPPAGSREIDVKAVISKIALGEADAGVVYVTDVRAARDTVEGVGIAPAHNVDARYPIAVLAEAPQPAAARAFTDFVLSDSGRKILGDYGFLSP